MRHAHASAEYSPSAATCRWGDPPVYMREIAGLAPVIAVVGGSWVAPRAMLAGGDWAGIEALARDAASLRKA